MAIKLRLNERIKSWAWVFIVLPIMVIFLFLIQDKPFVIDETVHYQIVKDVAERTITDDTFRRVPTFPGYHLALGLLIYLLKASSLASVRILSTIFSFFSVLVFYLAAKEIEPQKAIVKTLQYFFFPILFVFFFLVYTEVFSLLLVLLSFFFLTKGRYKIAGLFGLLSVLVRQNNIIWLGFFVLLIHRLQGQIPQSPYWGMGRRSAEGGVEQPRMKNPPASVLGEDSIILEKKRGGLSKKQIVNFLNDASIFLLTFGGLMVFIFWNKGPALPTLSETGTHPFSIHFANIFLFLLFYFFLFLPLNITNFPHLVRRSIEILRRKSWVVLLVGAFFVFYLFAFRADHPYNQAPLDYFLRNRLLSYIMRGDLVKAVFFIPIVYSVASLAVTQFRRQVFYLLYPFMAIFLSLSWLVEPRYYLIPFSFFILFKKEKSFLVEYTTIVVFMALAGWIFWGTLNQKFFW